MRCLLPSVRWVAALLVGVTPSAADAAIADEPPTSERRGPRDDAQVTTVRLDRVTPEEVAAIHADDVRAAIEKCLARRPSLRAVAHDDLPRVFCVDGVMEWRALHAARAILAGRGGAAVPVAMLTRDLTASLADALRRRVDNEGFYVGPPRFDVVFHASETRAREEKSLRAAENARGISLRTLRAAFRDVGREGAPREAAWLRPVRVVGRRSLVDVRSAAGVPPEARLVASGPEAVRAFHASPEGANGSRHFDVIASGLAGPGITERWLFVASDDDDDWTASYLVVLDEHDQLWGFAMGSGEHV